MYEVIRLRHVPPKVRALLQRAFPRYTGRTVTVVLTDRVTLDSHWDDGHRDYFVVVNPDGATLAPDSALSAPPVVTLDARTIVLRHSYAGQKQWVSILVHPACVGMASALGVPVAELPAPVSA